ncbi:hypothetical protein MVES1_001854 [Malassezia vespertilionis]|nr:uncharacterized protein MVES1_001854 [Malassezia vespertilionis]WFD06507.1 hypothetical protein MVES1_001854 [Malassezia vespertilionis]
MHAPLSEPELSTDESAASDDSECDRTHKAHSNAFRSFIALEASETPWQLQLAELARTARTERMQTQRIVYGDADSTAHEAMRAALFRSIPDANVDKSAYTNLPSAYTDSPSNSTVGSMSTTGTVTPRAPQERSRANSTSYSTSQARAGASAKEVAVQQVTQTTVEKPFASSPLSPKQAPAEPTPKPQKSNAHLPDIAPLRNTSNATKRSRTNMRSSRSQERFGPRGAQGSKAPISRTQVFQMLTMTQSNQDNKMSKTKPDPKKKKNPIVFVTGGEELGSDEEEVLETAELQDKQRAAPKAAAEADDDAWSSDDAAEEEEERQRQAERVNAQQKRKEEEERERLDMFKKRPIRSASLADLPLVNKTKEPPVDAKPLADVALGNTRGLLSTIFHPPREKDAPTYNTNSGAPRSRVGNKNNTRAGKTISFTDLPQRSMSSIDNTRNTSTPSLIANTLTSQRRASTTNVAMERSKSAIALPLLNVTSLRSSTHVRALELQRNASGASLNRGASSDSGSLCAESREQVLGQASSDLQAPPMMSSRSTGARARLSALAKGHLLDAEKASDNKLVTLVRSYSAAGMMLQGQEGKNVKYRRQRSSSPPVRLNRGDSPDEGPFLELLVDQNSTEVDFSRLRNVPQTTDDVPTPDGHTLSKHATSMIQLPAQKTDIVPALSPRTARNNMICDELSESVRENLLWEKQSRARFFGKDMPTSTATKGTNSPKPRAGSSRRTVSGSNAETTTGLRRSLEDESFHHKGW